MLVQLLTANFGTPASAYVTAQVLTNAGATQDLTSVTPLATWFTLAKLTASTGGTTVISITAVAVEGTATEGKIKITFDATATDPDIELGNILTLYGGAVIGSLGAVIGTTTMDTGVGTVTTAGQDLYITAPTLNRTKDIPYELTITGAKENGNAITYSITDIELTINGLDVNKLVITLVTPNTDNKYDYGEVIDFNVKYYHDNTELQFDGATDDAIIAALAPKTLPYS